MKISIRRSAAVACLVLASAVGVVGAQTTDTVTNVPFTFTAGTTALPRDHYIVSRLHNQNGAFLIRGERHGVVILSQPDSVNDREATPGMTFHRYGDQYFLREVRLAGGVAFRLPKTRVEIDAEERLAQHSRPELVVMPSTK